MIAVAAAASVPCSHLYPSLMNDLGEDETFGRGSDPAEVGPLGIERALEPTRTLTIYCFTALLLTSYFVSLPRFPASIPQRPSEDEIQLSVGTAQLVLSPATQGFQNSGVGSQ